MEQTHARWAADELGRPIGDVRMRPGVTVGEVARLARRPESVPLA